MCFGPSAVISFDINFIQDSCESIKIEVTHLSDLRVGGVPTSQWICVIRENELGSHRGRNQIGNYRLKYDPIVECKYFIENENLEWTQSTLLRKIKKKGENAINQIFSILNRPFSYSDIFSSSFCHCGLQKSPIAYDGSQMLQVLNIHT